MLLLLFLAGIVVTVKQRQEFRIRLQKRARRAAERKLETFMEDQQAKTVSPRKVFEISYQSEAMKYV